MRGFARADVVVNQLRQTYNRDISMMNVEARGTPKIKAAAAVGLNVNRTLTPPHLFIRSMLARLLYSVWNELYYDLSYQIPFDSI